MISHREATIQRHDLLNERMQKIRSVEIKLEEAETQERDWRRISTDLRNELNKLKAEARKLSESLFGESVDPRH